MKHGTVLLEEIYDIVRKNPKFYDFPKRSKIPGYTAKVRDLVANVADLRGVYLWGGYDKKRYWSSIYIGLAGLGTADKSYRLKSRIREELMDERSCFWRIRRGQKHIISARDDGQKERRRAIRKAGATHIVWVATDHLDDAAVRDLESELIEALSPRANDKRATPPSEIKREAARIYNAIRGEIHKNRKTAFQVTLK